MIVAFLAAANVFVRPGHLWFLWAAVPWALILTLHWLTTFDMIPFLNGDWERRQVEKYLGRKL